MNVSFSRYAQWVLIAFVLVMGAGLYWKNQGKNDVEAGITINAPREDHIATTVRGYWKMDEGTGTSTTADSSGNANTLTMTNADAED